jgi:arginase
MGATSTNAGKTCVLIGVPVQSGSGRLGCEMGPSAFRAAGLDQALIDLGFTVQDRGNVGPAPFRPVSHRNAALKALPEIVAWTETLADVAYRESALGMPIFLGGDHSLSGGTMVGLNRRAVENGRELFVLWLDAHPDFHTLDSTQSGNLHGTPVAYATGQPGFAGVFPPVAAPINPANVCMMGIRSVDATERAALTAAGVTVHDMRAIDENGVAPLLNRFLERVSAAEGQLHLSFDVDFLDPGIAPGVGTTVPGGATFREAHLLMEILHDSGLVTSLDLTELNPFLDERGRTALLQVDLVASLMGRRIMDRPTRSY